MEANKHYAGRLMDSQSPEFRAVVYKCQTVANHISQHIYVSEGKLYANWPTATAQPYYDLRRAIYQYFCGMAPERVGGSLNSYQIIEAFTYRWLLQGDLNQHKEDKWLYPLHSYWIEGVFNYVTAYPEKAAGISATRLLHTWGEGRDLAVLMRFLHGEERFRQLYDGVVDMIHTHPVQGINRQQQLFYRSLDATVEPSMRSARIHELSADLISVGRIDAEAIQSASELEAEEYATELLRRSAATSGLRRRERWEPYPPQPPRPTTERRR